MDLVQASVTQHVSLIYRQLRQRLRRDYQATLSASIEGQRGELTAKIHLLADRLVLPGPPLHVALDWVTSSSRRFALAGLLCGDWSIARYAKNYFARLLCPHTAAQRLKCAALQVDPETVCLSCWHERRAVVCETEAHVLLDCPRYENQRFDLRR